MVREAPTGVWENIVLYYLAKLKNGIWGSNSNQEHPVRGKRPTAPLAFRKENADTRRERVMRDVQGPPKPIAAKHTSLAKPKGKKKLNHSDKAYNIVNNALCYGCANGIVKKHGRYFYLTKERGQPSYRFKESSGPENVGPSKESSEEGVREGAKNRNRPGNTMRPPLLPKTLPKVRKVDKDRLKVLPRTILPRQEQYSQRRYTKRNLIDNEVGLLPEVERETLEDYGIPKRRRCTDSFPCRDDFQDSRRKRLHSWC